MAYTFTDVSADRIALGAPANGNTFSLRAKFTLNADTGAGGANRFVACYVDVGIALYQLALYFPAGTTNQLSFNFTKSSGTVVACPWTTGWSTPSTHDIVCTYNQTQLAIYADGSATPVATQAESAAPDQGSQTMTLGAVTGLSDAAPITLHDFGWWPGIVLSAADAAFLTSGYDSAYRFAPYHWRLRTNANARRGALAGTVSGATLAAHAPILSPPEALGVAA